MKIDKQFGLINDAGERKAINLLFRAEELIFSVLFRQGVFHPPFELSQYSVICATEMGIFYHI